MNPFKALRMVLRSPVRSAQLLEEIRDGIANLTDVLQSNLQSRAAAASDDANRAEEHLIAIREGIESLTGVKNRGSTTAAKQNSVLALPPEKLRTWHPRTRGRS